MKRTRQQLKDMAKGILNMLVADMIAEFDKLDKAILKLPNADWIEFLDRKEDEVFDILLSKFGSED